MRPLPNLMRATCVGASILFATMSTAQAQAPAPTSAPSLPEPMAPAALASTIPQPMVVAPGATSAVPAPQILRSVPEPRAAPGESRGLGVSLSLGLRTDLVRSAAFDPFSETDDLQQLSLAARYTLAPGAEDTSGARVLRFGVGVAWDHGNASAMVRGGSTSLNTDRMSVALEGQLPLWRQLALVARVAPGLLRRSATLSEASLPDAPYTTFSTYSASQVAKSFCADASLGLDLVVGRLQTSNIGSLGLAIAADLGYSFAAAKDVVFATGSGTTPGRTDEPIRLGSLAIGGMFFRFAGAVLF